MTRSIRVLGTFALALASGVLVAAAPGAAKKVHGTKHKKVKLVCKFASSEVLTLFPG